MPPSDVTRVADANVVHLENEIPLNGSFRLFIFGGIDNNSKCLTDLANGLQDPNSFYSRFAGKDNNSAAQDNHHEMDHPHSRFVSVCLTIAKPRPQIEISSLPPLLQDYSARIYADDIWDAKVPDSNAASHAKVGLEAGGIVVVRPDGHVGCVVALVEGQGTVDALESYFQGFMAKSESSLRPKVGQGRHLEKAREAVMARL